MEYFNDVICAPARANKDLEVTRIAHDVLQKNLGDSVDDQGVRLSEGLHFGMDVALLGNVVSNLGSLFYAGIMEGRGSREYLAKTFTSGGLITFGDAATNAVRIESLADKTTLLTPKISDFPFWMSLPKQFVPNVFHEFVQEIRHGSLNSQFDEISVAEGDIAAEDLDSDLRRRHIPLRTISTRTDVTIHAALTTNLNPGAKGFQHRAAATQVLRENAHQLFHGDSSKKVNQFDGLAVQHFDLTLKNTTYSRGIFKDVDEFLGSSQYLDLRGESLTKGQFDGRAATLSTYFGRSDMLVTHPVAVAEMNTTQNQDAQRWVPPKYDGIWGAGFSSLLSPANSGGTTVLPDQWVLPRNYKRYKADGQSTSSKAPAAPVISAVSGAVPAAIADSTTTSISFRMKAGDAGLGSRIYGVSAFNSYGESAITLISSAITLSATNHAARINVVAPVSTTATVVGYRLFSSDPVTDSSPTQSSPLYEVGLYDFADVKSATAGSFSGGAYQLLDHGLHLPNTTDAWIYDNEAISYAYLAPLSIIQLAINRLTTPVAAFMIGSLKLTAPTKVIRIANVKLGATPYNTNKH